MGKVGTLILAVLSFAVPLFGKETAGGGDAKILFVTLLSGSHLTSNLATARSLAARGHSVWLLADDRTHDLHVAPLLSAAPAAIRVLQYRASRARHGNMTQLRLIIAKNLGNSALERRMGDHVLDGAAAACRDMLDSGETLVRLRAVGFDMIVGDLASLCHVFLGQSIGVPYIHLGIMSLLPSMSGKFAGNPSCPAYVPGFMSLLADCMSFSERLQNAAQTWLASWFYSTHVLSHMEAVRRDYRIRPDADMGQLIAEARLWLFNQNFVVDFPRPLNPHVKFVGPVLEAPPKPLNEVR